MTWREGDAGRRLERDAEFIRKDVQRDELKFHRDLRMLEAYLRFDLQRWQDRQPLYRERIGEILRGKPEQIEPSAIVMFL